MTSRWPTLLRSRLSIEPIRYTGRIYLTNRTAFLADVSVIVPTFNRLQELSVALDSIFRQSMVQVECIVIDDNSDDGTLAYIREHYKDQHLVVIEKSRRSGPQASRNLGIAVARGEFITFLDSDDYFEPNTLAHRVRLCREQKLDALFSGYRVKFVGRRWDLVKNVRGASRTRPSGYAVALRDFKIAPMITIMYRREAHPDLKLDESLVSGEDDDLSLQLIRTCQFGFDDISSATIIQHVGERVATTRNLMIGDAQLLQKYAADIAEYHGQNYLTWRRAYALAGLWSVGQFRLSLALLSQGLAYSSLLIALILGSFYLPLRALAGLRKHAMIAAVRAVL